MRTHLTSCVAWQALRKEVISGTLLKLLPNHTISSFARLADRVQEIFPLKLSDDVRLSNARAVSARGWEMQTTIVFFPLVTRDFFVNYDVVY